jgi:hypothetical protein
MFFIFFLLNFNVRFDKAVFYPPAYYAEVIRSLIVLLWISGGLVDSRETDKRVSWALYPATVCYFLLYVNFDIYFVGKIPFMVNTLRDTNIIKIESPTDPLHSLNRQPVKLQILT